MIPRLLASLARWVPWPRRERLVCNCPSVVVMPWIVADAQGNVRKTGADLFCGFHGRFYPYRWTFRRKESK